MSSTEIWIAPLTSNNAEGLLFPIPTLPCTIKPLLGPEISPEYNVPIATDPSTSSLFIGVYVPIPTDPSTIKPLVGAVLWPG